MPETLNVRAELETMCLIERETKGAREKEGGKEGNKKRIKRGEEKEKCREKREGMVKYQTVVNMPLMKISNFESV